MVLLDVLLLVLPVGGWRLSDGTGTSGAPPGSGSQQQPGVGVQVLLSCSWSCWLLRKNAFLHSL